MLNNTTVSDNSSRFNNKQFNFSSNYRFSPNIIRGGYFSFSGLSAKYELGVTDNENSRNNITTFRSTTNSAENKDFDRRYQTQNNNIEQKLTLRTPNFTQLFVEDTKRLNTYFTNNFTNKIDKNKNLVTDLNTASGDYVANNYLTNQTKTIVFDDVVGLTLSKSYSKNLSNRYSKYTTINLEAKQRFVYQDNQSDKSFQNIKRTYSNFVPAISINRNNNQYGEYYNNFNISYNRNVNVPTLDQLAPLIDSTNVYNLRLGSLSLKEEIDNSFNFYFSHNTQHPKNNVNISVNGNYSFVDHDIVDSTFIDDQNLRKTYLINANGSRRYSAGFSIRKAYKLKSSELQLTLQANFNGDKKASYLNEAFSFARSLSNFNRFAVGYTYQGKFAIEGATALQYNQSEQKAFNTKYDGKTWTNTLSSSYNITKKWTVNSNISLNRSATSNAPSVNFNIWNASTIYRLLKGNNAEVKFSALDLLRQNNNVRNYAGLNSFTTTTQTVLQQYFMISFAYYPRQFGKNAKKN